MIEDVLEAIGESIADVKTKFYGVTTGQVINPVDPLMMGRVQVRLPFIDALDLSPWARVAVPMAGMLHGTYMLPNIGDEVLVAFEHGDVNAPYIVGSLWTAMAPPPLPSPLPQIRAIRSPIGNQVVFSEFDQSLTVQSGPTAPEVMPSPPSPAGPYSTIRLAPTGIQAMALSNIALTVSSTTVVMTQGSITLAVGGASVALTPDGVKINAPNVSITGGKITIVGGQVSIN